MTKCLLLLSLETQEAHQDYASGPPMFSLTNPNPQGDPAVNLAPRNRKVKFEVGAGGSTVATNSFSQTVNWSPSGPVLSDQ